MSVRTSSWQWIAGGILVLVGVLALLIGPVEVQNVITGKPDSAMASHSHETSVPATLPDSVAKPTGAVRHPVDVTPAATTLGTPDSHLPIAEARELAIQEPYSYLLMAESRQESDWLRRHGYPSTAQWHERARSVESDLRARVERGDMVAMALLADRLFDQPDRENEALALVELASIRGSAFANSLFALKLSEQFERLRESDPGMHPRKVSNNRRLIFSKLAASMMLGDRRAAEIMSVRAVDTDMGEHVQDLMTMAVQRIAEINASRVAIGLPPLQVEYRP